MASPQGSLKGFVRSWWCPIPIENQYVFCSGQFCPYYSVCVAGVIATSSWGQGRKRRTQQSSGAGGGLVDYLLRPPLVSCFPAVATGGSLNVSIIWILGQKDALSGPQPTVHYIRAKQRVTQRGVMARGRVTAAYDSWLCCALLSCPPCGGTIRRS